MQENEREFWSSPSRRLTDVKAKAETKKVKRKIQTCLTTSYLSHSNHVVKISSINIPHLLGGLMICLRPSGRTLDDQRSRDWKIWWLHHSTDCLVGKILSTGRDQRGGRPRKNMWTGRGRRQIERKVGVSSLLLQVRGCWGLPPPLWVDHLWPPLSLSALQFSRHGCFRAGPSERSVAIGTPRNSNILISE